MGLAGAVRGLAGGKIPAALGHRVRRPGAATDLAATAAVNIFRVSGGDVLLTALHGIVTTIIGAVGATTIQIQHTPTGGAAADVCTATAINTDAVNTIYTITGDHTAGLAVSANVGIADASFATNLVILVPGIITMVVAVSVNTGVIDWILHYVPLDTDSRISPL